MAISAPHYRLLRLLARRGELPIGGSILEIGEANWYGDVSHAELMTDIGAIPDEAHKSRVISVLPKHGDIDWSFQVVKAVYEMLCQPAVVQSIDLDGTQAAMRRDLNGRVALGRQFDTVINHGTAEHVFDIANVFRVIHSHTKVGGLMIHESPFTGWVDHGFYNLQPTLFYDVAAANQYDIRLLAVEQIEGCVTIEIARRESIHKLASEGRLPLNAMLYVSMRKTVAAPFAVPIQGVYSGSLSDSAVQAWRCLR